MSEEHLEKALLASGREDQDVVRHLSEDGIFEDDEHPSNPVVSWGVIDHNHSKKDVIDEESHISLSKPNSKKVDPLVKRSSRQRDKHFKKRSSSSRGVKGEANTASAAKDATELQPASGKEGFGRSVQFRRSSDAVPIVEKNFLEDSHHEDDSHSIPMPGSKTSNYESYDFDDHLSLVKQKHIRNRSAAQKRTEVITKWVLTFLVSIFIAMIAVLIRTSSYWISKYKFDITQEYLHADKVGASVMVFILFNAALVLVGSYLTAYVEPMARSSGIPEIKSTLNGLKIPKIVRIRTLFVKVIGVICGVAANMPMGAEGPMIHVGAIVGAGVSQGKSTSFALSSSFKYFKPFRNDREKRDFISCGAAAGVACAFGAPIGGVLFALEEGSSFWNLGLTWRTFFCAMCAVFIWQMIWATVNHDNANLGSEDLFIFGAVSEFHSSMFNLVELFFFLAVGVLGGLLGSLYNHFNKRISLWRMKNTKTPEAQIYEILGISVVVSMVVFLLPYAFGTCMDSSDSPGLRFVRFTCPEGQYHDLATLMFTQSDLAINQLLHSESDFTYTSLGLFFISYFPLSCWMSGSCIPSGIFIPSLLAGSAMGRFIGQLLHRGVTTIAIQPGTYALIGAASLLGGIARVTISLTVMMIEATGDIQHGLPVMIACMVSKMVGDYFTHGIYHVIIHIKHYDFLEWYPPEIADFLLAMDVMHTHVICFKEVVQVSEIWRTLKSCDHNGFPIVSSGSNELRGLVLKKHLIMILYHRQFFKQQPEPYTLDPLLNYEDLEDRYPRYRELDSIELSQEDLDSWIDLTPYMNPSPYFMQEHSPVSHVFNLFRTMGLRHLPIVDKSNEVVGMITRKDLTDLKFKNQLRSLINNQPPESPSHSKLENRKQNFSYSGL